MSDFVLVSMAARKKQSPNIIFNTILEEASPAQIALRSPITVIGILQGSAGLPVLSAITAVVFAAEPFPCRLTTQELVDLLKMPTCFGAARRDPLLRQPLRPAVRQPLGLRELCSGARPRSGLRHTAEAVRSEGIPRKDAPDPRRTGWEKVSRAAGIQGESPVS